jgi:predicted  nucleic acid-binding Zn-ribbon protein
MSIWSRIRKTAKRTGRKMTQNNKLKEWQSKLETAKNEYSDTRSKLIEYEDFYEGTRNVKEDPNTHQNVTKQATNVRNICYELIESQVDSAIPMPKVIAMHPEDDELAKKIERLLENKVKLCHFENINDSMERTVPIDGGDYFYVTWDPSAGLHSQLGDVKVSEITPFKLIPQPGVTEIDDMDYFFVQELYTKKKVKAIYGVDVEDAVNDQMDIYREEEKVSDNTDLVTVNTAYYKNEDGGIGRYVWCDTYELEDLEDYQSRQLDRCAKCGAIMENGVCPQCGGKKAKKTPQDYEDLVDAIEVEEVGGETKQTIQPEEMTEEPVLDENGQPVMDETGRPQVEIKRTKKKIPYYKPKCYPVILRRSITNSGKLFGSSDISVIEDQQETVKKLGSKINEKLLKGGSFVTLPKGVKVDLNEKDLKVIRIENPQQTSMITTINLQPDISKDSNYLETNYQWAKSSLGITDSFQGKYDASATSGTAKQYQINQASGRLESKRVMKEQAYAKLYEVMFKFLLAYSDDDMLITGTDANGAPTHESLNRYDFLRLDKAGELYWDDEFIFTTDPTSTLLQNREALWNQTDMKLQSGAFGQVGDLETARAYWTIQKANGYPNASTVLNIIEQRIEEQKAQEQQTQQINDLAAQIQNGSQGGGMPQ